MTAPSQTLRLPLRCAAKGARPLPQGCEVVLRAEELANTNAVVSRLAGWASFRSC